MLSFGRFSARALSIASRSRGLPPGSPPPSRAATVISRISRVKIFPRFASARSFRCLTFAQRLCPAMVLIILYGMAAPLLVAKSGSTALQLLPALANRHALITGATGTGKSVTLQTLAQRFSSIGVPVFMADVKGDLTGLAKAGGANPKVDERRKQLKLPAESAACPVIFWDVFGKAGHPVRATISDMGPLLLGRMLGLNETQEGVLAVVFKIADDNGLLLLDLKDLRAMLEYVGDNAAQFKTQYGNVSPASIGIVQRQLLTLEAQGAAQFFGEPMLEIGDLMRVQGGQGMVSILSADKLMG